MKTKTILVVVMLFITMTYHPKLLVADDTIPAKTIDTYLHEIFGSKEKIAKAVFTHESNYVIDSINYNCRYGGISKSCRRGDIGKAWSVDCGIGQINVKGKECPAKLLTLEGNMVAVASIYKEQGLNAWVSYNTGRYKKYL